MDVSVSGWPRHSDSWVRTLPIGGPAGRPMPNTSVRGHLAYMDTGGLFYPRYFDVSNFVARVDEMAYDPGLHQAYCSSRQGKISVIAVAADKLTALADVPDEPGAGDIAVDAKTHIVWVAYSKDGQCFAEPFVPAAK